MFTDCPGVKQTPGEGFVIENVAPIAKLGNKRKTRVSVIKDRARI
jgi:hypothetical protein